MKKTRSEKDNNEKNSLTVILDDEIYDRHTQDTDLKKEEQENFNFEGWEIINGYVDNEIASVFMIKEEKLHFYCLKKHRQQARELLNQALKLHQRKIYCEIPTLYKSVINFAKKGGFKTIGTKKNDWLKNGKNYDVEILKWEAYSVAAASQMLLKKPQIRQVSI